MRIRTLRSKNQSRFYSAHSNHLAFHFLLTHSPPTPALVMGSLVHPCPFPLTSWLTDSVNRLKCSNKKLSTIAVEFLSTGVSQQQCRTVASHGVDLMSHRLQLLPIRSQIHFIALLPASPHPVEECIESYISFSLCLLVNRSLPLDLGNFAFNVCNVTLCPCQPGMCPGGWVTGIGGVLLGFSPALAFVLARWGRGPSNTPGCWTS